MTNNKFLQRVYEANPDGWEIQALCGIRGWVVALNQESDEILEHTRVRLRPILPEGIPEPPEKVYLYGPEQGGFPLGFGRVQLPQGAYTFRGWACDKCTGIIYDDLWHGNSVNNFYILDVSDSNARAILEANGLWPGDKEHPHDKARRVFDDPLEAVIVIREAIKEQVRQELIAEGWTPPDGLTEESRKCYSMTGLKEFVAKHHPHARVEDGDERPGFFDVVFDGPPSRVSGRFVEVENEQGRSIRKGAWIARPDGFWALRIPECSPDAKRDEWVTLDECDIEVRIEGSTEEWAECDFCDDDAHAFHLIETLCTGGSRAVRIRRRDGGGL